MLGALLPGRAWSGGLSATDMSFRLSLFLALLGAAGLHFGLPGGRPHLPLLALLFPACLYLQGTLARSNRQAFGLGWLTGLLGNAAGLYWMVFPMHDVAGLPFAAAGICVLLLFACLACYSGLTALAARRLCLTADSLASSGRAFSTIGRLLLPPLLTGAAFAGFEVLCGLLFTGFPWLALNTAFALRPVWVQGASLIGGSGVSAVLAAAACCAAAAFSTRPAEKAVLHTPPAENAALPVHRAAHQGIYPAARPLLRVGLPLLLACLLLGSLPAYGLLRPRTLPADAPVLSLIMVQGNVDQGQKWNPAFQQETVERYLDLSRQALSAARQGSGPAPALLLWPETAMPFTFPLHLEHSATLRAFAADNNINLAFGALGYDSDGNGKNPGAYHLYNRLYLLSSSGRLSGQYEKEHLVPFGEYLPFAPVFPFLRDLLQGLDFSSGSATAPLLLPLPASGTNDRPPAFSLGVLICYEAIFPALAQERVTQGADILVNISNDGWFRKSSAPWQHLSHAVMRAVEQGRPMLRGTNTGVTALIDPFGTIIARTPDLFVPETLTGTVRAASGLTVFHRLHPAPEICLSALALLSLFSYSIITSTHRKTNVSAP